MRRYSALDQLIEVEVRAFPAFWWLSAGFEVRVNGQTFHPRVGGTGFFAPPITEFYVMNDHQPIPGMVRGIGRGFFVRRKRYSLVIGMSELARDTQPVRGWLPACLVTLAFWIVVLVTAAGALTAGWMLWTRFHPGLP